MCFFLTVAVPKKFAGRMGEAFGRGFQSCRTANPGITSALPLNFEARLILSGMCSCDLYTRPKRDSVDPVELSANGMRSAAGAGPRQSVPSHNRWRRPLGE